MKCPFCSHLDNRVIDSRLSREGDVTRRRRECARCERRFTTYERVEEILPLVVKKDGRRETYDRLKVIAGLKKACEKRPISITTIEESADRIERFLQSRGDKEISSAVIGEEVMRQLYDLDKVAYVRFASVYRSFQDLDAFMRELKDLIEERNDGAEKKRVRQRSGRRPALVAAPKSR
jgi:transcriptional repressor NrdR